MHELHVLNDPTASTWLREALRSALERDPVDAANDAEALAQLLVQRAERLLVGAPSAPTRFN